MGHDALLEIAIKQIPQALRLEHVLQLGYIVKVGKTKMGETGGAIGTLTRRATGGVSGVAIGEAAGRSAGEAIGSTPGEVPVGTVTGVITGGSTGEIAGKVLIATGGVDDGKAVG